MGKLDNCPACGAGPDERAFVAYQPDPNDAQAETAWGQGLETVHVVVCRDCGEEVGVVVHRDTSDDGDGGSDFEVDDVLR